MLSVNTDPLPVTHPGFHFRGFWTGEPTVLYAIFFKLTIEMIKNGQTRRVNDETVRTLAFEIAGTNVATAYMCCPSDPKASLGITLPFLVMQIKNMKRYFTFEVQVLDDQNMKRRFRFSNYQSASRVRPFGCSMPIGLTEGWNQLNINLPNFTRRAYGTNYLETVRIQVHANCRIRRIYFADKLYSDEALPKAYRMYQQSEPEGPKTKQ